MTVAAVVLAVPTRHPGSSRRIPARQERAGRRQAVGPLPAVAAGVEAAGLDELIVVVADETLAAGLPDSATVLLDESAEPSECSALRAALDWSGRNGHGAVVVGISPLTGVPPAPLVDPGRWRSLAAAAGGPVVIAAGKGEGSPVRIDAAAWPLLPLQGELATLWRSRPEIVSSFDPSSSSPDGATGGERPLSIAAPQPPPSAADLEAVTALLGRPPAGAFAVVVRDAAGRPVVIENAPLLDDGTPMPTRWWLVGRAAREAVSRLESAGGVSEAEAAVPPSELAVAHARYAELRDALLPAGHVGPTPSGGVGGTRQGVKCLHAHLAAYLAGTGDPVGRWTAERLAGELDGAVAALDCGTNSTRLLIAGPNGAQLERRMTITKLGEGVDESGHLSDAAIGRTLAALRDYRALMDRHGVVRARATATSAARDADNAAALMQPARAVLGVPLEVLGGLEEGTLSYRGATAGLDPAIGPVLVVDLGGGSTELIASDRPPGGPISDPPAGRIAALPSSAGLAVVSIPAGCVRMTERYLRDDPPRPEEIAAARSAVAALLEEALGATPALRSPKAMVGVAGTVTSLAALNLGLDRYDPSRTHHSVLTRADVEGLLAELAAMNACDRRARRPLEPGRADVIVGGAAVLAEVMSAMGHDSIVVSESDSLDGLVASMLTGLTV